MKYFLVSVDKNYIAPSPLGWNGILSRNILHEKKAHQMPKHMLFQVEGHMQMVFTDVITFPCFMVSEVIMNVIKKYDRFTKFVRIVLFDKEKKKSMTYYLPFLDSKDSIDEVVLNEKVIMEIEKKSKLCVVMRMDLIESILRRGVVGLGLEETNLS